MSGLKHVRLPYQSRDWDRRRKLIIAGGVSTGEHRRLVGVHFGESATDNYHRLSEFSCLDDKLPSFHQLFLQQEVLFA